MDMKQFLPVINLVIDDREMGDLLELIDAFQGFKFVVAEMDLIIVIIMGGDFVNFTNVAVDKVYLAVCNLG